ncbi:hypothetical protein GSI_09303 [Ganoderma sinense ZZ0214-1]|uniref:Uncharacterized protein n=1 Tax=Ganoderma sinense ZZ0214-1 TaxID=1077348 RepID=A0A2G8S695_9APHY|nr:hypothetical protein GSI_09303 [Ganoderma sinense ZZ0214-1]
MHPRESRRSLPPPTLPTHRPADIIAWSPNFDVRRWSATNHNAQDYALEISRNNLAIIKILRDHPNDEQVADYTITTFAYAILRLIPSQAQPNPRFFADISLIPVLSALLDTLRNPDVLLEETLRAALTVLGQAPPVCPKQCQLKDVPSLLSYYAALSRSRHIGARCNGIAALLGFGSVELKQASVQGENPPVVTRSGHIHGREYASQEALLSKLPDDLRSLMVGYGVDDCEYVVESRASCNAGRALSRYNIDEDTRAFGRRVAELLELTEYPINPNTTLDPDAVDDSDMKALDILSMCAASLAYDESPAEEDAANIIELHYLLVANRDLERAQHRAQLTVQHNPNLAYGYYAMSLAAPDAVSRYRAIQKGLACKGLGLTPFLRRQLLSRAVVVAGEHAISLLRDVGKAQPNPDVPRLAKAYCKEAIDAAKLFIEIAPPDARQLPEILNWYIVLMIIVEGPGLRDDLLEYEPLLEKLATAERFTEVLDPNPAKTNIQYAREWLFEHYRSGSVRQWERLIVRLGEMADSQASRVATANQGPPPAVSHTFSAITANGVRLDECAWCENSTVAVQKCSRCGQVNVQAVLTRGFVTGKVLQQILPEASLASTQGVVQFLDVYVTCV